MGKWYARRWVRLLPSREVLWFLSTLCCLASWTLPAIAQDRTPIAISTPRPTRTAFAACSARELNRCTGGIDDDCDGKVDCADSDCARDVYCLAAAGPTATRTAAVPCRARELNRCTDGIDDDCDGLVDCADPDCNHTVACSAPRTATPPATKVATCFAREINLCSDALDNDCDGDTDCFDDDCSRSADCRSTRTPTPTRTPTCALRELGACTNGIDDDCDGAIDCADSNCVTEPLCRSDQTATPTPTATPDGVSMRIGAADRVNSDTDLRYSISLYVSKASCPHSRLELALPASVTVISTEPPIAEESADRHDGVVVWDLGNLNGPISINVDAIVHVDPGIALGSQILATATMSDASGDSLQQQRLTRVGGATRVEPGNSDGDDLLLRVHAAKQVAAGGDIRVVMSLTALASASDILVRTSLPAGVSIRAAQPTTDRSPDGNEGGAVEWRIGQLDRGQSQRFELRLSTVPTLPSGTVVTLPIEAIQPGDAPVLVNSSTKIR